MLRNVELLYPTPLHYAYISGKVKQEVQEELNDAYKKINWTHPEHWGKTHDLSTSDFKQDDITRYNLVKFKSMMHNELEIYCEYLNFKIKNYKTISWFSQFKPNDFGDSHNHGNSDISGVYYFKTNGNDGNIFFHTPVTNAETSLCYTKFTESWSHKPEEGKILLFPGWLTHGIRRNETNNIRVSFSFNIHFER